MIHTRIHRPRRLCGAGHRGPVRHGFTVLEVIIALGLFASFGLLAARAFTGTTRLSHQTTSAQNQLIRSQRLIDRLQRDAWGATALSSASPSEVRLASADGASVTWRWEDGVLLRQEAAQIDRWAEAAADARFAVEGPVLAITLTDSAGQAITIRLPSQVRLGLKEAP